RWSEWGPFPSSRTTNGRRRGQAHQLRRARPGNHAPEGVWAIFDAQLRICRAQWPAGPLGEDRGKYLWAAHRSAAHPDRRVQFEECYLQPGSENYVSRLWRLPLRMAQ